MKLGCSASPIGYGSSSVAVGRRCPRGDGCRRLVSRSRVGWLSGAAASAGARAGREDPRARRHRRPGLGRLTRPHRLWRCRDSPRPRPGKPRTSRPARRRARRLRLRRARRLRLRRARRLRLRRARRLRLRRARRLRLRRARRLRLRRARRLRLRRARRLRLRRARRLRLRRARRLRLRRARRLRLRRARRLRLRRARRLRLRRARRLRLRRARRLRLRRARRLRLRRARRLRLRRLPRLRFVVGVVCVVGVVGDVLRDQPIASVCVGAAIQEALGECGVDGALRLVSLRRVGESALRTNHALEHVEHVVHEHGRRLLVAALARVVGLLVS